MRGWMGGRVRGLVMVLLAAAALAVPVPAAAATVGAGTAWQIQDSPDITVPSGQVQAVSCPLASACTAVGSYLDADGLNVPLAEAWNGSSWKQQAVPSPAGGTLPSLNGVSCISASFCEAVGENDVPGDDGGPGFAEMWNGSSWSLQALPSPAGVTAILLRSVSCVSASFCEAVGSYLSSSDDIVSLAEDWNGTAWTVQSTPSQAAPTPTELDGVSCVSVGFCVAVDFYGALVEEWNGTSWAAHSVPYPSGMSSPGLTSVSCLSQTFCEAIGLYDNPEASNPETIFAEKWNGTSWQDQSAPNPGALSSVLLGVSCVSATFCEAVGYREVYASGVDTFRGQAEVWRGKSWQLQSVPSAGGTALTQLAGVSCATADACEAGGSSPVRMKVWNGTAWAAQQAVVPRAAAGNTLTGVSCVSATFCEAVGSVAAYPAELAEVWNGSAWKVQVQSRTTSLPPLTAVSCVSATFCEAVGDNYTPGEDAAQVWNGTSWQPQPAPADGYTAVSCASATFCQATGREGAAMWNGTAWSAESLPVPITGGYYTGMSCVSADACEAVGNGPAPTGGTFAAGWNGTSWTAQTVSGPPGATRNSLTSVSCAPDSTCEAVGESTAGAYTAAWNGTTWTTQAILPLPAGAVSETITGLACTSATVCTAAGYSKGLTLVETWNGTAWSIQPTPDPAASSNVLDGVSCITAGHCVAVGSAPDPGGINATLVETTG